jgi:histidinol-phosphate aminotransferase
MLVAPGDPSSPRSAPTRPSTSTSRASAGAPTVPYAGDARGPRRAPRQGAREQARSSSTSPTPTTRWAAGTPPPPSPALDAVPDGTLLDRSTRPTSTSPPTASRPPIDATDPRVIRMRTFSKGYGLAGLRVGYAIGARGPDPAFDKVRNHFGVGRIAQAGALAALPTSRGSRRSAQGRRRPRPHRPIARENGLAPCPPPPTSSPSTAAATAPSPAPCSTAHRPRRLRPDALRRPARPLHPHLLRDRGRSRHPRRSPARSARRRVTLR